MSYARRTASRITIFTAATLAAVAIAAVEPEGPSATQPTTRDAAYERLLGGSTASDRPLLPTPRAGSDSTTGNGAVQPGAPSLPTRREGSYIVNQTGRLTKAGDGQGWEFAFNADGSALQDPPMKVLPNLKLMGMETQLESLGVDLQFRVTGMVTEYRGRNYILFEKVIVVQNNK